MGKKIDAFQVGDLVFARVRGFPAWPAKIVAVTKSKKYSVYFYGTGESANIVAKDLFSYSRTKSQFATDKHLKKPAFKEAIDQIEAALNGDDSAPTELPEGVDTTVDSTFDQTTNTIDTTAADDSKFDETNGDEMNDDADDGIDNGDADSAPRIDNPSTLQAIDENNGSNSPAPIALPAISTPIVAGIVAKIEPKSEDKNISRSGRVIKRKKYLMEEEDAPTTPTNKRKRPADSPATVQKRRKSDEGSGENEPEQVNSRRQLLEIENMLLKYDLDIKASLQLSAADPAKCLRVLEDYKSLNVTALMLKKNPSTVETVKRLRRYVGNIKDWNFDESQRSEFEEKAIKIRKLAEAIYKNFKKLFNYSSADTFWQSFSEDVELFKQKTKEMSRNDLLKLTEEPAGDRKPLDTKNSIRV